MSEEEKGQGVAVEAPEPVVEMDCLVSKWKLVEQLAYREKIDVNPQYAMLMIGKAVESADPEIYTNINPRWLLGIAWITARRRDETVTMDDIAERYDYDELVNGMLAWADALEEAAKAARPTRAPRKTAQRRK